MAELVTKKIIMCGNIVEMYEYGNGYLKGFNSKTPQGRIKDYKSENYEERRPDVIKRAKRELRRLINANVGQHGDMTPKFVTLTFREQVTDIKQANRLYSKFIQRLNYHVYDSKKAIIQYNVVIEFMENGRIHYHAIFYNLPYIPNKELAEIWGNGYVRINKIDNVSNVGAYVSEYMGKDEQGKTDERLEGKKLYFSSRNLYKPLEITEKKIVEAMARSLLSESKIYSYEFESEHLGNIQYSQYVLK